MQVRFAPNAAWSDNSHCTSPGGTQASNCVRASPPSPRTSLTAFAAAASPPMDSHADSAASLSDSEIIGSIRSTTHDAAPASVPSPLSSLSSLVSSPSSSPASVASS